MAVPHPKGLHQCLHQLSAVRDNSGQFETTPDKTAGDADGAESPTADDVSGAGVIQKHPLPCADSGCDLVDLRGFEPLTSALRTQRSSNLSDAGKGLRDEPPTACTNACTSETQKLLEVLAATLRSLSDEDRARLAELIQRED